MTSALVSWAAVACSRTKARRRTLPSVIER
jgi:hypothetical protein